MNKQMQWLFVIDTNSYAGNFEREMCSYITGHVGECGVGEEYRGALKKDTGLDPDKFFENVIRLPDDHDCYRPATIWLTPGWANDGMGHEYRLKCSNDEENHNIYVKSVTDYYTPLIEQAKGHIKKMLEGKSLQGWTIEAAEREIARHKKKIEEAEKNKKVERCPAYMSVGIWFESRPTKEQIKILKERAYLFCKVSKDVKITIEGFRVIKKETVEKHEEEGV